jgi:hypothetical protein
MYMIIYIICTNSIHRPKCLEVCESFLGCCQTLIAEQRFSWQLQFLLNHGYGSKRRQKSCHFQYWTIQMWDNNPNFEFIHIVIMKFIILSSSILNSSCCIYANLCHVFQAFNFWIKTYKNRRSQHAGSRFEDARTIQLGEPEKHQRCAKTSQPEMIWLVVGIVVNSGW